MFALPANMNAEPLLSIIIVSYNTREVLRACLASVQAYAGVPHETIVVDNASPDGSADMVASAFPEVRLLRNTDNVGFSPANNSGMAMARGAYILLLNPDTLVRPGVISAWQESHQRVAASISGTRLIGRDGSFQVSAWRVPGILDAMLELLLLHKLVQRTHYPPAAFSSDLQSEFVSGAAMLFAREIWERTGGLDPGMFWMEDADLCYRIRQQGGSCWFLNSSGIVHIGGESAKGNPDRAIPNQLLSRIKYTRKHHGPFATLLMAIIIGLHALTRAVAFGAIALFRHEPRARSYRIALHRWYTYLFKNDRSI